MPNEPKADLCCLCKYAPAVVSFPLDDPESPPKRYCAECMDYLCWSMDVLARDGEL